MAVVKLEHIWKRYGDIVAVQDFNLETADGEFVVLVGPSGCGKTTTLRLLAGLEEVSEGLITFDGEQMQDVDVQDRDVAMVFQSYALYPHRNVFDNLGFALKLRRYPKQEVERRVRAAARTLGIETLLERKPRELSGGQRQRVALGRALVREPKVFLMDEPLSNLDAKLRVDMRAEIAKLHQRLGVTTFYVTHDQVEAMTMGERIVVMKDGLVQQIATPLGLYDEPVNTYVAGFIGSPAMNFLQAQVVESGSAVQGEGFRIQVDEAMRQTLASRGIQRVIAGVRPEHLRLSGKAPGIGAIKGTVELVEQLGSVTEIRFAMDGQVLRAQVERDQRIRMGDGIELAVEPGRLHLFDVESTQRLTVSDGAGRTSQSPSEDSFAAGG